MRRFLLGALMVAVAVSPRGLGAGEKKDEGKQPEKTVAVKKQAPEFKIKDSQGELIDLAKLTASSAVVFADAENELPERCQLHVFAARFAVFVAVERLPAPPSWKRFTIFDIAQQNSLPCLCHTKQTP